MHFNLSNVRSICDAEMADDVDEIVVRAFLVNLKSEHNKKHIKLSDVIM